MSRLRFGFGTAPVYLFNFSFVPRSPGTVNTRKTYTNSGADRDPDEAKDSENSDGTGDADNRLAPDAFGTSVRYVRNRRLELAVTGLFLWLIL